MNAITRIQVEFGEPAAQVQIPVKDASRLAGIEVMLSRIKPGSFTPVAGSNDRSASVNRFIARIREILRDESAE